MEYKHNLLSQYPHWELFFLSMFGIIVKPAIDTFTFINKKVIAS